MREELARVVLREVLQRGCKHVELRRDGPHTIFFCTLCGTRCYSDAALADHLNGQRHARLSGPVQDSAEVQGHPQGLHNFPQDLKPLSTRISEEPEGSFSVLTNEGSYEGGETTQEETELAVSSTSAALVASSTTSLTWIGSGQLFLKTHSNNGTPLVEAAWFCWQGMHKPVEMSGQEGNAGRMDYAVVVFPYSDQIGRGGDWTSLNATNPRDTPAIKDMSPSRRDKIFKKASDPGTKPQVSREIVVYKETVPSAPPDKAPSALTLTIRIKPSETISGEVLQMDGEPVKHGVIKDEVITTIPKGWKRKQAKNIDRVCFICHQKLLPGKDVAALVNVKSGQMMCGSRNERGGFHVFHSTCIIDWIAFCEAKAWSESCKVNRNKKSRKSRQAGLDQTLGGDNKQESGTKTGVVEEGAIFCPECQGTGAKVKGSQLERPRFHLAQVFEWLLELVQARKEWMDHPVLYVKGASGLLFMTPEKLKSQGVIQSQGLIHCYSAGSSGVLAANEITRKA